MYGIVTTITIMFCILEAKRVALQYPPPPAPDATAPVK